jgi:medium-chain acyl-[acyl-carrier-protein] hydrolase
MIYSRNYLIHYYEIDNKRKLTLPALIHYFEDIAIQNSEAVGFTLDYYEKENRGWMLMKWEIEIFRFPAFNETITINTQPKSFKNFLANREYEVVDASGAVLVKATTVWLLADIKTRRPVRVPEEMYSGFDTAKDSDKIFQKLNDLVPITEGEFSSDVVVQKNDIDTNGHVNNVRYVEWVLESLPKEFLDEHTVTRVEVNNKKELNFGESAEVVSTIDKANTIVSKHSLFNNGKDICHIRLEWK